MLLTMFAQSACIYEVLQSTLWGSNLHN